MVKLVGVPLILDFLVGLLSQVSLTRLIIGLFVERERERESVCLSVCPLCVTL